MAQFFSGEKPEHHLIDRDQFKDIGEPDYPSLKERAAQGKLARKRLARSAQGEFVPAEDRRDPVAILLEQGESRAPELLPIRHGRMADNAFAFFRGGAAIMAADLGAQESTGLRVQACGDAHLSNFGIFSTPERKLIFDVNDFDETLPAPWEWDLKRLVASLEIAGRVRRFAAGSREKIVAEAARTYRTAMDEFAQMQNADVWYSQLDADRFERMLDADIAVPQKRGAITRHIKRKVTQHTRLGAFERLTRVEDGERRIVSQPPLVVPVDELLTAEEYERFIPTIRQFLKNYRSSLGSSHLALLDMYRFADMGRKVVGVGSVGLRAWIVLMLGRDDHDPMFLQLKEAQESVLALYAGRARYRNQGRRVVEGQRLMQAASDPLLGWYDIVGFDGKPHQFYVRQLWDGKFSIDPYKMREELYCTYGSLCAWTLARAHARTGQRVAIASYLGTSDTFDRAMVQFAQAYAEQNEQDYGRFLEAIDAGQVLAEPGV